MRITPATWFFTDEETRRLYVDVEYKYWEMCGVPYLAILLTLDSNGIVIDLDFERINLSYEDAKPMMDEIRKKCIGKQPYPKAFGVESK